MTVTRPITRRCGSPLVLARDNSPAGPGPCVIGTVAFEPATFGSQSCSEGLVTPRPTVDFAGLAIAYWPSLAHVGWNPPLVIPPSWLAPDSSLLRPPPFWSTATGPLRLGLGRVRWRLSEARVET